MDKPKPPTPRQYKEAAIQEALNFVTIVRCKSCLWPRVSGYLCHYCGGE